MKKILFFAAAMAAMTACSEAAVEMITPEVEGDALHEVTISANTSEEADSRVTIDETSNNWVVKWESDDALLAVDCSNTSTQSTLYLSDGAGTSSATFTGSAPTNDYYLIYPATCGSQISDSNLSIDLTSQSNGANSTFMISESYVANDAATLKQIGAIVDLTMTFPYDSYNGATIESIEVSGFNSKCSVVVNSMFNGSTDNNEKSTIIITDCSAAIANKTATARFNIIATTIAIDDKVTVTAYVKNSDSTVTPLTKTLTVTESMTFARAKHHTISCTLAEVSYDDEDVWTNHAADSFSGESVDGSVTKPYEIATAEELALLAYNVNNGISKYTDIYFKQTANIDLSDYEWVAIGVSTSKQFEGIFDGDGHKVSGLYINQSSTDYQGLFGYIGKDGSQSLQPTIKNLSVSGYVAGNDFTGGIVGYARVSSVISNCSNSATVIGTGEKTGGVVGQLYDKSSVIDCYNSGSVKGNKYVGGVVGRTYYASVNIYCYVTNCYNIGSVKGTNSNVGGILGEGTYCDVTNCYNSGSVEGYGNVGGVVGYSSVNDVTNCYNSGSVKGTSSNVGGVLGEMVGDDTIDDCYYLSGTATYGVGSSASDGPTTVRSAEYMMEATFLSNLNTDAATINGTDGKTACEWITGVDGYPTLNFGVYQNTAD